MFCACEMFQAQRNNEDVDTIKPLFSVDVDHRVRRKLKVTVPFRNIGTSHENAWNLYKIDYSFNTNHPHPHTILERVRALSLF